MRPYGMNVWQYHDTDCGGSSANGRATSVYNLKSRSYQSLRRGKKNATRRVIKRVERQRGKAQIKEQTSE